MHYKKATLFFLIVALYGLVFYFILTMQFRMDFTSFYEASLAFAKGLNPYKSLFVDYLRLPTVLNVNLNPPFFLEILIPLASLPYLLALIIWSLLSFFAGLAGAAIVASILYSKEEERRHRLITFCLYLTMYCSILNHVIGQLGGFLLFFIMLGYYAYIRKKDYYAGFLWGFIAAIKLFPVLLMVLAFSQKRYRVVFAMALTVLFACLIPLMSHGMGIYEIYFRLFFKVNWYGDNWNASIHGFLYRFSPKKLELIPVLVFLRVILLVGLFIWYLRLIKSVAFHARDHRAFCLSLVVMLLLSPLGWLYYFPILLMPLILSYEEAATVSSSSLWIFSFFLINFPLGYIQASHMENAFFALSVYSIHFFGLVVLTYQIRNLFKAKQNVAIGETSSILGRSFLAYPIANILAFGMFIPLISFILHMLQNNT